MGSCHLSSIQTKPKQAKLYQSKLCQAKPWQAPTSPLPTYFLDGVEPIRVQKPKHQKPSTPQFRHNGTTSWPVSPARPAYRRWTEAPGDFGRVRCRTESPPGSPPLFFSVRFFSEKKRTTASALCGEESNVTVTLYASKGASFLRNIGCSGRCPDPAGTLSLHSARGAASGLRHLLKKVDENFILPFPVAFLLLPSPSSPRRSPVYPPPGASPSPPGRYGYRHSHPPPPYG